MTVERRGHFDPDEKPNDPKGREEGAMLMRCLPFCVGSNPATSGPYAEQIHGKTPSVYGIGRAGAKLRDISMSEKKLNYFAKLIRRMHVEDALAQCKLQPKKAGSICAKVWLQLIA